MISRNEEKGFFAAHWDWLVAGVGAVALLAAVIGFFAACGTDPDRMAGEEVASLGRGASQCGVDAVNMTGYALAMKALESPTTVVEPAETQGSFLASGSRVFCEQGEVASGKKACGLPIAFGLKVCPFCGVKQPEEVKIALDSDGDGIPDELEKKWGMNPNDPTDVDADKDGDGFTNREEFLAKTDPTDPKSHPDYLDSLKLVPPLQETLLPFVFERAIPIGTKVRFVFKDPNKRNDYGTKGLTYSVLAGEPIGQTGFVAKSYEKKIQKVKIAGSNVSRDQDVSTATVARTSDGKQIVLQVGNARRAAVDVQAKLVYERNSIKEFTVVPGDTIDLNGAIYKVTEIVRDGKTAKVTLEDANSVKKTLEALEP